MYKTDIINALAAKTGNTKQTSEFFLQELIQTILESLSKGEDVSLIGFASFKVVETKAKKGRNPKTGKEIKIPAGKKVKFVAGKGLKDVIKK